MAYKRLGDLLISAGVINDRQLEEGLKAQKETGKRLGATLIDKGIITERQLIDALERQLGVDFVDLTAITVPLELAKVVPKRIAKTYTVVPVKMERDRLYLAMADPLDFMAQEEVKTVSHKQVIPMVARKKDVEQTIFSLYGNEGTAKVIEEMMRESGNMNRDIVPVQMISTDDDDTSAAPTIRFVNSVIERAFMEHASDIHLEPQENEMLVRMRIDGVLVRMFAVPNELQNTVISRLKIIGGMNISEHKIPQDGHAMITIKDHPLDLRINTLPTIYGEKVVIRVLDKGTGNITKESIGLVGADLEKYERLLKNSSGVILLVGPTGSGKSTTLFTMIKEIATDRVNVVTLEDPVEYNIDGVNQCQINEKTGMTFASGLRAILRQDPDIISVGEIRDGETGTIAIRAAITGHLVFSTLHTNDAASTFARLADIGVEPYLTVNALRGVISQRLVRKLCPHCRRPYKPDVSELEGLSIPEGTDCEFYMSEGCSECNHTGFRGRTGVFEILMVDPNVRKAVNAGEDSHGIMEAARINGFTSMRQNCARLVREGITSYAEAMKAINSAEE